MKSVSENRSSSAALDASLLDRIFALAADPLRLAMDNITSDGQRGAEQAVISHQRPRNGYMMFRACHDSVVRSDPCRLPSADDPMDGEKTKNGATKLSSDTASIWKKLSVNDKAIFDKLARDDRDTLRAKVDTTDQHGGRSVGPMRTIKTTNRMRRVPTPYPIWPLCSMPASAYAHASPACLPTLSEQDQMPPPSIIPSRGSKRSGADKKSKLAEEPLVLDLSRLSIRI